MNQPGSRFCNYCGNDLNFAIQPDGTLPPGAILRGSYVIENVIGEGGMGVVYSCHHRTLGTRYALKVLDPKLARMDILRQRFLAEAKIQATVRHPHIVHVLDVIDSDKDGGIPGILAIVMEYVEGEALDQRLENGPLSEKDAVSCALVILDAIGFAHHASIVHRDLKPQNIMISSAEAKEALYQGVKVMDFGIAKLLQDNEQRTVTGAHMGTPRYMAPEQIENARDVDERTDLYAIGLTLYELLCGKSPFEEYREFELIKAQMSMKPPSIRNYRNDISDRLEAIIMKSLEKDRANRYPNAESFQRALLSLGGYDEIPLMLNPYEGTTILPTNQKLQKKIERAIAKSNEAGNDGKSEKTDKSAKSKASSPSARKAAKDIAAQVVASAALSEKKQVEAEKEPQSASSSSKSEAVDAFARTESDGEIPKATSTPSTGKVSREKKEPHISETPSRSFKVKKTSLSRSKLSHRTGISEALENKAEARESAENKTSKPKGISDKHPKVQNTQEKPSKVQTPSDKHPKVQNASDKELPVAKKSVQTPVVKRDADSSAAKTKSSLSLKIVGIILLLLVIAGLVYRYQKNMSVPTVDVIPEPQKTEITETFAAKEIIDDVSKVPLREIETETGRMTFVPAAKHWISAGKSENIHQIELAGFAIDQLEVSYYQYEQCSEAGKCPPLGGVPVDLNMPVTGLGYGSAEAFCVFAGKSLPTAEQWEAAARFGGSTNGITDVNVTCQNIHFGSGSECKKTNPAHPESVFKRTQSSNPGHILNMLGNVREWTTTPDKKDPQKRIVKGGSYRSDRAEINIGAAQSVGMNAGADDVGFRCVKNNP